MSGIAALFGGGAKAAPMPPPPPPQIGEATGQTASVLERSRERGKFGPADTILTGPGTSSGLGKMGTNASGMAPKRSMLGG